MANWQTPKAAPTRTASGRPDRREQAPRPRAAAKLSIERLKASARDVAIMAIPGPDNTVESDGLRLAAEMPDPLVSPGRPSGRRARHGGSGRRPEPSKSVDANPAESKRRRVATPQ
ncbi:hypothetical protein GCM10007856_37480 [Azospirillum oryzae]|nr:hypothetical protein GCM10007856_37480 [Azospirillum oryzae]